MQFPEKALKCECHSLIVSSNPVTVYVIYEIAKAAGHEVVHLPTYHCELNPIEMAWAQVKGYIKVHNTTFTLKPGSQYVAQLRGAVQRGACNDL